VVFGLGFILLIPKERITKNFGTREFTSFPIVAQKAVDG